MELGKLGVWAGRDSREALASTMFETEGQA